MRPQTEMKIDYLDLENEWVCFSGSIEEFQDVKKEIYAMDSQLKSMGKCFTWKLRVRPMDIRLPLSDEGE
eukprot:CAMPEP_0117439690 /NCGR_PEP_ID=MMETSP0759-20121206/2693_1 /TAXON_ID=63605 /ORGANISM="Percolomonas cosmopolitus, Strain WS" /LENGTH=69 /DNA_ID=CAMNT_0005231409 /DNA_START=208 /DNA_END=417 /DNA_ORIENTATION=+